MTTALIKSPTKKPATKKPATKKAKAKKAPKPGKAAPSEAMLSAAADMSDDVTDLLCDLDDAADAETVDQFNAAAAQASKKLVRVMQRMAALAGKIDPEAFAAAQEKARQLPAVRAPALMQ